MAISEQSYPAQPFQRTSKSRTSKSFERLAEPLRRELNLHCYRMLGSLHDAEDLVQETYLRAWRNFDRFQAGSFRAWMYRICTNACLNALAQRKHLKRLLPDQIGPSTQEMPDGLPATEVAWLEPYPNALLEGIADDAPTPDARYEFHETVQLAFVSAIQQLPPRQRAALLLCDVLDWSAAEAATLIGGTTISINSALQRARKTLSSRYPADRSKEAPQPTPTQQELLDRYIKAWEGNDLDGFVALLKEDAITTMPPWLQWYAGRDAMGLLFEATQKTMGSLRLMPTAANGDPAFAVYERFDANKQWAARSIHVLTLQDDMISTLTTFVPPTGRLLFESFGLPLTLP